MMRRTLEQIKPDPSSVFPATLETDRRCINLDGKDGGTIKETFLWVFGPEQYLVPSKGKGEDILIQARRAQE